MVVFLLPTPFTSSGDIDLESLRRVVDLFLADEVDGFTALGVTGEVARLTDTERDAVLDSIIAVVDGRVPIVAGTTAEGLRTCVDYTRRAKAAGASAVMISPPRMLKINSEAVAQHFADVAAAVEIPIIVQDYPPISGYAMEAALLARIAREVPAARTIKLEIRLMPLQDIKFALAKGRRSHFRRSRRCLSLEELMAGAAGPCDFGLGRCRTDRPVFRAGQIDEAADLFTGTSR